MGRSWSFVLCGWGLLWLAGCQHATTSEAISATEEAGRAAPPATAATTSSATTSSARTSAAAKSAAALPSPQTPPEGVVRAFLEASREERDEFASQLLSEKARDAAESAGLVLDPPGTPTMQFEIGDVEFPAEEPLAAYVTSQWREEAGPDSETFEVVWILRKQADGWRIAGMASRDTADSPPTLVNFEDPEDLARIRHEVAGEPLADGDVAPAAAGVRERTARRPGEGRR